jgi:predicted O-methyltransferase YrrM
MFKQYGEFLENHRYYLNNVPVDKNHASLVFSTCISLKPKKILELGIGSGLLTNSLMAAKLYNGYGDLTSVDSFYDWSFVKPDHVKAFESTGLLSIVVKDEKDFVLSCKEKYDLVVVDGNHNEGHLWANEIFSLVNSGGILFAHDVIAYPNLGIYMDLAKSKGYGFKVFKESSRQDEACGRGLIEVFID